MFDDERITWSIDGGGRFFFRPANKYSVTNVSGWMKVINNDVLNSKFLFYVLSDLWKNKAYDYTKKAHPSVIRNEYIVPIPPIPIQQEIVSILDNFTRLEAELEAELEARKKQYDYYRNQLLTPKEIDGKWYLNGKEVEWKTLGDVCSISSGGTPSKSEKSYWLNGTIPWLKSEVCKEKLVFNSNDFIPQLGFQKSSAKLFSKNTTLIALVGATKCITAYLMFQSTTNQNIAGIKSRDEEQLKDKFVFFYYMNQYQELIKNLGKYDMLNLGQIRGFKIPIPPIYEQERIVSILDRFDALVNDISIGLPAEIAARRKQYEYYRGKLLTFKNRAEA